MAISATDFSSSDGELILINNMICNNGVGTTSDSQTDALFILDILDCYFSNNTIANNDAGDSSAVIIKADDFDCSLDIWNSIFWDNSIDPSGYQLELLGTVDGELTIEVGYNSFEDDEDGFYLNGYVTESYLESSYNWELEPSFINSTTNDFRIQSSSACKNVGVDPDDTNADPYPKASDAYIPDWDFEGDPRPELSGTYYDIGADEYAP